MSSGEITKLMLAKNWKELSDAEKLAVGQYLNGLFYDKAVYNYREAQRCARLGYIATNDQKTPKQLAAEMRISIATVIKLRLAMSLDKQTLTAIEKKGIDPNSFKNLTPQHGGRRNVKLTEADARKICDLKAQGVSYRSMARQFNAHENTVSFHARKFRGEN